MSHWGFDLRFLVLSDVERLFMGPVGHLFILFGKSMSIRVSPLPRLLIGLVS